MDKKIIHTVFEKTAEEFAEKVAVRFENYSITYRDLNCKANQLAHLLKSLHVERDNAVGVLTSLSPALVQSVLAVFKSGGVYLPIDINHSQDRILQSFSDCMPDVVITDVVNADRVKLLISGFTLDVKNLIVTGEQKFELFSIVDGEFIRQNVAESVFDSANPKLKIEPDDSNYIFYTSGSTGLAKAILGCHKGLGHFINWEKETFNIDESCNVSLLSQFTFDASLRDIFIPLCTGGTLCIPSADTKNNFAGLLKWIEENKVSIIHCVPSLFRVITKELDEYTGRELIQHQLDHILMAGEPLYAKDILAWRKVMGENTELINLYGTSETTLAKTFHRIKNLPSDPTHALHVGKPINNTAIAVFNDTELCSAGEIGEIYIKTPFRSKGYYKNELLTNEVFIQNPLVGDRVDLMHRTGDYGRLTEDGNLEVLGRKDEQVKVNGIRVELGEIRQKVSKIKGVEEVEVLAYRNSNSENELVCYFTGEKYDADLLIEELQKTLNRGVMPTFFVHLEKFPLTVNGKIDKKSLPKPEELLVSDDDYEPTQGAMEKELEGMWVELLGLKRIGRNVSFFKIGGNSLKAMLLISKVFKAFKTLIKINEIFNNQTIAKIANLIQYADASLNYSNISQAPIAENYELSLAQKGVFISCQSANDVITYNIPLSYQLKGVLNKEAFSKAFETLVERHESLRSNFLMIEGRPKQIVHPISTLGFSVHYIDMRGMNNKNGKAVDFANQHAITRFDLAEGRLLKASLLQLDDEDYIFLLTMHHIISDGWSMEIVIQEITSLYNAFNKGETNSLAPLKIQYKDYVNWQHKQLGGDALHRSRNYWLSKFENEIPPLQFPTDYIRQNEQDFEGGAKNYSINADLVKKIKNQCDQKNCTLFMYLLSAVNVLVYKYTGRRDIVFGSPIAGRSHPDLENQIGLYVNMLALRTTFDSGMSFSTLLELVKKNSMEAFEHATYPFAQFVEDIDSVYGRKTNFFDIVVQLQNAKLNKTKELQLDGINFDNFLPNSYSSKFEITFNFEDIDATNEIALDIEYKTGLFKPDTIEKLKDDLFRLLQIVTEKPMLTIRDVRKELTQEDNTQPTRELEAFIEHGIDTDY